MKKIVVVFFLMFSAIFAKPAYEISNLNIIANINTDGSVDIQERILYRIEDINGIFYNIDALGFGKLKNLEIFYEDNGSGNFQKARKSTYLKRGNYTVAERDGLYTIKIYDPTKKRKKEFIFLYTLTDGVKVYKDIAQLNRKMVGKAWNEPIKHIEVTINLPEQVPTEDLYAFGHGPLNGNIEILNEREIRYTLDNYYPDKFLEVNLLFPTYLISKIDESKKIDEYILAKTLLKEKKLAKKANLNRKKANNQIKFGKVVFSLGLGWWLFIVIYIYIKNSKKHKVTNTYGEYFRDLPDNFSPAVVGTLIDRKSSPESKELFATILDLIRKKRLNLIEENGKTVLEVADTPKISLKDYEKFLFKWYINELGDGKRVVLEDINDQIAKKSNARMYNANFERWQTMVYTDMLYKNLRNDKPDSLSCGMGVATGIVFFMGGMTLMEYFQTPIFLAWIFLGFFLFPYTMSRKRYSFEKEAAYSRWKAFKKFLLDYSNLREAKIDSIKIWEHYFVYAVALGVAEKFVKIYERITRRKFEERSFTSDNFTLMDVYMYNRAIENLSINTERAVRSSLESIASSNLSSEIGSGGGFSGDSSGGGGDRGGGGAF